MSVNRAKRLKIAAGLRRAIKSLCVDFAEFALDRLTGEKFERKLLENAFDDWDKK